MLPYRIDLAGGWLDQPFISKLARGPVIVASIEPDPKFRTRCGLATSTRARAADIWGADLPAEDPGKLARILFDYENPPGTKQFSGSQDALGICLPGVHRLDYAGDYWPEKITAAPPAAATWIEQHLSLIPLSPRPETYDPGAGSFKGKIAAERLSTTAIRCWNSLTNLDLKEFGFWMKEAFHAQLKMFPAMNTPEIAAATASRSDLMGWKLSGAGGGGYLIVVSERIPAGNIRIKIRR